MASEDTPLLPIVRRNAQYNSSRKACCIQSKAARLILLWYFAVLLAYNMFYNINAYIQVSHYTALPILIPTIFIFIGMLSPVAGLLTDVKFSRFKAVQCSSYIILVKNSLFLLLVVISAIVLIKAYNLINIRIEIVLPLYCVFLIMVTVYMIFIINGIQFGMDQLHDSLTEDSILFIYWYVWIYYTCSLSSQIDWNFLLYDRYYIDYTDIIRTLGLSFASLILISTVFLLTVSLCVIYYRKVWFLLEPAGVNPYKLVYRVVKFAYQHKVPLRRSAFTYCDEESPTRLDVGKHKFGGPFTTKQVEDVKAFWGILKVLITIGPAFLLQTVMQSLLPLFAKHGNTFLNTTAHHEVHLEGVARYILISNGLLSPLLIVICIPLYLCLIRPHITYYIPGMLKRIQIALVVMVLSLICTFVMDVVVHVNHTV